MIQASRAGRIQLLPTPDYGRFRRGEAQYDIDQDPVWLYQAQAQAFDAVAFYQCDHLGTPQELTDMNGEIAWAAEYKAWGYAYDALSKAGRQAGLKQPLRFQGQYYDHETGLHYNRHRYYDPHSGRFVSKDPIGLNGGWNSHKYVSNPMTWVDPMGLASHAVSMMPLGRDEDSPGKIMSAYPNCVAKGMSTDICSADAKARVDARRDKVKEDYLACSGGALAVNGGFAINLHNKQKYIQGGKSPVLTGVKPGGSCVIGFILNKDKLMGEAEATDAFLGGFGGQVGFCYGLCVGINRSLTKEEKNNIAAEFGVGSPGASASMGGLSHGNSARFL